MSSTITHGRTALVAGVAALSGVQEDGKVWLADLLEVSLGTVQKWLSGLGRPDLLNALKLLQILGIPVEAWQTDPERRALTLLGLKSATLHAALFAADKAVPRAVPVDDRQLDWVAPKDGEEQGVEGSSQTGEPGE